MHLEIYMSIDFVYLKTTYYQMKGKICLKDVTRNIPHAVVFMFICLFYVFVSVWARS